MPTRLRDTAYGQHRHDQAPKPIDPPPAEPAPDAKQAPEPKASKPAKPAAKDKGKDSEATGS
jgi:hypothetical protein